VGVGAVVLGGGGSWWCGGWLNGNSPRARVEVGAVSLVVQ